MARRPSRRDDAVTTEPVSDYDPEDQFVGGMDLATGLAIFTTLFILFGIGWIYKAGLVDMYDVGKDPMDHYRGVDTRLRPDQQQPADEGTGEEDTGGGEEGGGDESGGGGEGGGDEGGGDEGGEKKSDEGGDEEWD